MTIVTTTINNPTEAILAYLRLAQEQDFQVIIVGDKRTPHEQYDRLEVEYEGVLTYLTPEAQTDLDPKLSELIGWNCIQRRNLGLLYALLHTSSEWIATVDDDNIPYEYWGDTSVKPEITINSNYGVVDPLALTAKSRAWHRGFPIQLLHTRHEIKISGNIDPLQPKVIAGLWDGAPDIDAVARIALPGIDEGAINNWGTFFPAFNSNSLMPFNSQNTILHRSCFPTYFLFPGVGRMDDIFASYLLQHKLGAGIVTFTEATVLQERNEHDLAHDLEQELIGYHGAVLAIKGAESLLELIPERALKAYTRFKEILK